MSLKCVALLAYLCNTKDKDHTVALHDDVLAPQACFEDVVIAQSIPAAKARALSRQNTRKKMIGKRQNSFFACS